MMTAVKDDEHQARKREVAALLEQAMDRAGFTQVEVARLFGIHKSTVNGWITGRTSPDLVEFADLCRIFKVSADELLGVSDKGIQRRPLDTLRAARMALEGAIELMAKANSRPDGPESGTSGKQLSGHRTVEGRPKRRR